MYYSSKPVGLHVARVRGLGPAPGRHGGICRVGRGAPTSSRRRCPGAHAVPSWGLRVGGPATGGPRWPGRTRAVPAEPRCPGRTRASLAELALLRPNPRVTYPTSSPSRCSGAMPLVSARLPRRVASGWACPRWCGLGGCGGRGVPRGGVRRQLVPGVRCRVPASVRGPMPGSRQDARSWIPGTAPVPPVSPRIACGGSIGGPLLRFAVPGRGASMETRCCWGNVAVPSLR